MSTAANLALDGGDPREPDFAPEGGMTAFRMHLLNDPNVSFEEYLYYASITRAQEKAEYDATPKEKKTLKGMIKNRFRVHSPTPKEAPSPPQASITGGDEKVALDADEKHGVNPEADQPVQIRHYTDPSQVSEEEWKTLSRGIRTAGWSTCFYLITTDILGPFSTPYVVMPC
jgi:hypothetical protein